MQAQFALESTSEVVCRIRAEFLEMPGLRLTPRQAQRLMGLGTESCSRSLASLVSVGFLARTRDGVYALRDGRFVR
jgi:hypothetical protein